MGKLSLGTFSGSSYSSVPDSLDEQLNHWNSNLVKRSDDKLVAILLDNEDVGVFVCGMVFSLQEVEFRREHCGKTTGIPNSLSM